MTSPPAVTRARWLPLGLVLVGAALLVAALLGWSLWLGPGSPVGGADADPELVSTSFDPYAGDLLAPYGRLRDALAEG
ncbi:MAG TPA: hypothetical protein VFD39_12190, partial [Trueperaceae bacterium]|nr:hypothetical protein [Trueperaceae bacterium]